MNKKVMNLLSGLGIVAILFFSSCGGSAPKEEAKSEPAVEEAAQAATETVAESEAASDEFAVGKKIYEEKCVVCHQADAKGLPGAFPPLAESDYLLADPIRGIEQTLNGSHEEMVVNGITYNAPMTPQVDTKEEALAVINYVLNNFGNDAGVLTMEDIKDIQIKPRGE